MIFEITRENIESESLFPVSLSVVPLLSAQTARHRFLLLFHTRLDPFLFWTTTTTALFGFEDVAVWDKREVDWDNDFLINKAQS